MNARPPADARTLLAQASPRGRALFRLVRRLLDELEQVVPWSLLYAPPADAVQLAGRLDEMLARIERSPEEVAAELDALARAARADEEREAIAEAEFYFATLHQMTAADRQRLGTALARAAPARPATRAAVDQLCELAADLKGKYTSAIMGAAAALVSEGRWQGVEFEAMLFPEKAEEAERNRRLLQALETLARAQRTVMASFPWQAVLASWSAGRPPDRYALVDLVSLRAHLLRLLTVANRRALYSGDYQQLRERETRLGARLRELEALHLRALELPQGEIAAAPFERLRELLLEIAALFDADVVRALLGDERVRELRAAPPAAARDDAEAGLAALLAEEDLKTFVDLLVGAVRKRASIAFRAAPPEPGGAAGAVETPEAAPPRRVAPEVGRRFGVRLVGALGRLTAADNPRWRAFQMVHKLQARLGALPPALWHEILPLLGELAADLLPLLDEAVAAGAVPVAAVEHLRGCAERLAERDLARPESAAESAGDLARIVRLLESLEAAATALAAGR